MCDLGHTRESWLADGSSEKSAFVGVTHDLSVEVTLGTHVELWDGRGCKLVAVADMLVSLVGSRDYKLSVDTRTHIQSRYKMNAIVYWMAQDTDPGK